MRRAVILGNLASAAAAVDAARASLGASGHARLPALEWERLLGVPLSAMASTVDALQARGFPPVFLLMYDQPWALCAQLVSEAAAVMQAEVELDPSVFVWSLSRAVGAGAAVDGAAERREQRRGCNRRAVDDGIGGDDGANGIRNNNSSGCSSNSSNNKHRTRTNIKKNKT